MIEREFKGIKFQFEETGQADLLAKEIFGDNYRVFAKGIEIRPGDVILDIGACEGMFSIMMSKVFPESRVIAFEPVERAYGYLKKNIELNGAKVEAYNLGVAKVSAQRTLHVGLNNFNGGSSGVMTFDPDKHFKQVTTCLSLDDLFDWCKIDRCRLLKIDIEGMEYEVLYHSSVLQRVDYITGEVHMNTVLDTDGYRMLGLANWLSDRTEIVHLEPCRMAE